MIIAQCLEYPIEQHGGTEVLVREIIRGLASEHKIVLVSPDTPATLHASPLASLIAEHIPWDRSRADVSAARRLAFRLKEAKVDLAHFHFGGTFDWGCRRLGFAPPLHLSRLKVPVVATNHGAFGPFDGYIGPQRSLLTKLLLWPAATASRLQLLSSLKVEVAVSRHDYRALRRRYGFQRHKFRQIYHSRIHEQESVATPPRSKTVLCVGTIGSRKGQPFLVEAFAQMASTFPEWNLLLIGRGEGEPAADLRRRLAQPELLGRATWIPGCSDDELKNWFPSVEIFAMPSLHEGLGLTLQEALYYRCACIGTRVGGVPDLITHDDNGLLVPPADSRALAEGLALLMGNSSLRDRFRARGRESVLEKDMTAERMVGRYRRLYAEVM